MVAGVETTVEDMTSFSNLTLELINGNLQRRYEEDTIYTLSGPGILISVNPYKQIPSLYSQSAMRSHRPAHIYSIAEQAYSNVTRIDSRDQSLVISGESGAGKTETTKHVLQYLCSTNRADNWMEAQILEANVVLEAFGNARTVRNDNSSRFGKFLQVVFKSDSIAGCIVQDYLLEKSRIVRQGEGERNYHVFYQLLSAGEETELLATKYSLKSTYSYLASRCTTGEPAKFQELLLAMNILQIPEHYIDGIFRVLSSILWLGELKYEELDGGESVTIKGGRSDLDVVEQLLGINLEKLLLQREIQVRGSVTVIPLRLDEASENRHSMAKSLYSRVFSWLIEHINNCTRPAAHSESSSRRFIGLLDIFGFENFATNSFEQLCINYANEKLQRFFNYYVLGREVEIYLEEGLSIQEINYSDNSNCLELIEKPPRCLLKLLSEQCTMPKGSDSGYLINLHSDFSLHPNFGRPADPRLHSTQFNILHYAGLVTYNVLGFVDKNRDVGQESFFSNLSLSGCEFVRELSLQNEQNNCSTAAPVSTIKKSTVCEGFRLQLQNLVSLLEKTGVWYIRCIKPNSSKSPCNYDPTLVMDQLRYLGMVEVIRIRREGYPVHYEFSEFVRRFGRPGNNVRDKGTASQILQEHVSSKGAPTTKTRYQIGFKKVFIKLDLNNELESNRSNMLNAMATRIQSRWRRYLKYGAYRRKRVAAMRIQSWFRSRRERLAYLKIRWAAVTIQAALRGLYGREAAAALRLARISKVELLDGDFDERDLGELEGGSFEKVGSSIPSLVTTDNEEEDIGAATTTTTDAESGGQEEELQSRSPSPLPEPPNIIDYKLPEPSAAAPPPPPPEFATPPPPQKLLQPKVTQPPPQMQNQEKVRPPTSTPPPAPPPQQPMATPPIATPINTEIKVGTTTAPPTNDEPIYSDPHPSPHSYLTSFATQYFNPQLLKSNKLDAITTYTKSTTIATSHTHLYDPENVVLAKLIWKDLHRVIKSESCNSIQTIIGHGIERQELRDEIYVQILRQLVQTPLQRYEDNLWALLTLVVCSFPPSKPLLKSVYGFLEAAAPTSSSTAKWCLTHLGNSLPRELPPSSVEVTAARRQSPLSIRVYFLDSRSLALEVFPKDTAVNLTRRLSAKIGLTTSGWYLYSVCVDRGEIIREEHVAMHSYLYDVVAGWEMDHQTSNNRLLFKKRVFKPGEELGGADLRLVYCQMLYEVVRKHSFPLNINQLVKLAGIQCRVLHLDDYDYNNIEAYLPARLLNTGKRDELIRLVQEAHRSCNSVSTQDGGRLLYINLLSNYGYYGVTMFPCSYKSLNSEPGATWLGIGASRLQTPTAVVPYQQIKSITKSSQSELTFSIYNADQLTLETESVKEVTSLIGAYSERLCVKRSDGAIIVPRLSNRERQGLLNHLDKVRTELIDSEVVVKDEGLISTLKRIGKKDGPSKFWTWSKVGSAAAPIGKFVEQESGRELFQLLIHYGGQSTPDKTSSVGVIQQILHKTWSDVPLYNELYLQLIRQTTGHSSPNSSTNVRNWSLLSLVCSLRLPTIGLIKKYLLAHLRFAGYDHVTQNGVGGRWAEKCLQETANSNQRSLLPSQLEILSTVAMRPVPIRVYLLDGKFQTVLIKPSETIDHLLLQVLDRVGLTREAKGYSLYEYSINQERSLNPEESPCELLSRWEQSKSTYKFILKKHLYIDGWLDLAHPVEKELIYLQLLHSTKLDRYPLSETEAAVLVALQAQIELGDFKSSSEGEFPDYCHVSSKCLATRTAAVVSFEAVARQHKSLEGSQVHVVKQGVINLLQTWGYWKGSVFEVAQSFTSSWPRLLWLAVDQIGVHLTARQRSSPLASFEYESIHSFTPSPTYFLLIASNSRGQDAKPSKIILNTSSGYQIGQLIRDYINSVFSRPEIVVQ